MELAWYWIAGIIAAISYLIYYFYSKEEVNYESMVKIVFKEIFI